MLFLSISSHLVLFDFSLSVSFSLLSSCDGIFGLWSFVVLMTPWWLSTLGFGSHVSFTITRWGLAVLNTPFLEISLRKQHMRKARTKRESRRLEALWGRETWWSAWACRRVWAKGGEELRAPEQGQMRVNCRRVWTKFWVASNMMQEPLFIDAKAQGSRVTGTTLTDSRFRLARAKKRANG